MARRFCGGCRDGSSAYIAGSLHTAKTVVALYQFDLICTSIFLIETSPVKVLVLAQILPRTSPRLLDPASYASAS
jgi:hypothetical protein